MKVLSILGSPNIDGNTAKVLSWVEDELRASGHEVERINLIEKDISYCVGCFHCQGYPDEPACAQDDDAIELYDKLINCDGFIIASPLYGWSFTALMKTFLDRCLALATGYTSDAHKSLVEGVKSALLVTCGGPVEGNCDLLPQIYRRIMRYAKTAQSGETIIPYCTSPDQMGPEVKGKARELAHRLME